MCGRASMLYLHMIKVFAGKVRKTGFFQKAGFPGNSERIFGINYRMNQFWRLLSGDLGEEAREA
jgi:hypothetical protein